MHARVRGVSGRPRQALARPPAAFTLTAPTPHGIVDNMNGKPAHQGEHVETKSSLHLRIDHAILGRLRDLARVSGRNVQDLIRDYAAEGLLRDERRFGLAQPSGN